MGGFLRLHLLIAGTPFGFGLSGSADERPIRADTLMSSKNGCEDPLNDALDSLVK